MSTHIMVTPDTDNFTVSVCNCRECTLMHQAQVEWDTFTPQTHLQRGMKDVVARIERRIATSDPQ